MGDDVGAGGQGDGAVQEALVKCAPGHVVDCDWCVVVGGVDRSADDGVGLRRASGVGQGGDGVEVYGRVECLGAHGALQRGCAGGVLQLGGVICFGGGDGGGCGLGRCGGCGHQGRCLIDKWALEGKG